jgi:hypothetical protein
MKAQLAVLALGLATSSLFASADLSIRSPLTSSTVKAGETLNVSYEVHNSGPDRATNVVVTVTISGAKASPDCSAGCPIGDIASGQYGGLFEQLTFPNQGGTVTLTASVSSGVADPNMGDNSQTTTLIVSTDPDVAVAVFARTPLDLGVPFPLSIYLANSSHTVAHDVNVTVDFPPDVSVRTLPAGCTNPIAGRLLCTLDTLEPGGSTQPSFVATLVPPVAFRTGSLTFTATVTERENDFAPATNTAKISLQLYNTIYVTTGANDGIGSLRQVILDVNANCTSVTNCAIGFRIEEPSANPWKTITITSPLPAITASNIRVDGGTQTGLLGDTNPDGPEIEITGRGITDGDGLLVTNCAIEVANLVINGFLRNGISLAEPSVPCSVRGAFLHHLFIGTDPTGTLARPNARGIGTSFANGTSLGSAGAAGTIQDSVISGNLHSGIFGMSGRLNIARNRIGVKAHSDDPLPNGNAGVFIGAGGYGSDVGADSSISFSGAAENGNVIAFNGQMGVGVAAGVADVAIRSNRIWGNALLGIDIGLDGPTQTSAGISMPSLTLAHYDPVLGKTVVEGDINTSISTFTVSIDFFGNDAPDPTGLGEGQRPLGSVRVDSLLPAHFRFTVEGDLTGQFISATTTRVRYVGFAKPEGITKALLTQTSEFSPTIEVR